MAARKRSRRDGGAVQEHVLLTGFPGFISKPLLRQLLASESTFVTAVVEDSRRGDADAAVAALPPSQRARLRMLPGDVRHMDLGLSGAELKLLGDVTIVLHLAGVQRTQASVELLHAVNVDGVRHALQLASEFPKLRRFVHFSSCFVAGDRQGVVLEEHLDSSAIRRPP
jgi:nucleoside-diphosphate-sugar epimerase